MKAETIQTKYQESFNFLQLRKKRQAEQLKLLSNMRRGDQNISSTLLLSLFDRIMSNTYDDKIQVKFIPAQGINQNQINSYNILAQSDYQEMGKAKLDYDWTWDTLFFGRGYMETVRFDMKRKIMQPHVINPLVFGYDPYIENVQDWRYYWKWITKSKGDLKLLQKAGVLKKDLKLDSLPAGIDPYLWQYKIVRDQARDAVAPPIEPVDNDVFQILEFYGVNEDGVKCVYWVDKNFSSVLYEKELDFEDGEEIVMPDGETVKKGSSWPIVVKESFRIPHSSVPISVADLLEDKHRAKAVLLNLAYIAAKDEANPVYLYNSDKVNDISQFLSRQINQHIPVNDVETAVAPLNKASTMSPELMNFIQMLTEEANEPIGTGQALQPKKNQSDTATGQAIDQQLNDLAQSLQSKVMQFGESEFWGQWFHRYAKHAEELETKMANIVGVKGVDTKIIDLNDFKTDYPPGVMVYSAKEAEYKELVLRRDLSNALPVLVQSMDQDGLRNFYKHVYWPKFLQDPSLVDIMFPKTLDEMNAEAENEQLADGMMPDVKDTDNHTTHIYTHMMLQPKTWAGWTHIHWHQELLAQQLSQQQKQGGGSQGGENKVSESINYKDLPPDGQQQMAAKVGISIAPPPPVDNSTATKGAKIGGKAGTSKSAGTSTIASATPLKSSINPKTVIK